MLVIFGDNMCNMDKDLNFFPDIVEILDRQYFKKFIDTSISFEKITDLHVLCFLKLLPLIHMF